MLIQRLVEWGRGKTFLYDDSPFRYGVDVAAPSRLLDLTVDGQPLRKNAPRMGRNGCKPFALSDTGEYTFGTAMKTEERASEYNHAYIQQTQSLADAISHPGLLAAVRFLSDWRDGKRSFVLPDEYDPGARVALLYNGVFLFELPEVVAWWQTQMTPADLPEGQCLACGQIRGIVNRMPSKINGVPGGQPSGTALISADKSAFTSHGLSAAQNSPLCFECAEYHAGGLNRLLRSRQHTIRLPEMVIIHFDPLLRQALWAGDPISPNTITDYTTVLMSANGGRISIRDFFDGQNSAQNLARWQALAREREESKPVGLFYLTYALERRGGTIEPWIYSSLLNAALRALPLPALFRRRVLAGNVAHRNTQILIEIMNQEDGVDASKGTSAIIGHLMAEFDRLQYLTVGEVGKTLSERYMRNVADCPHRVSDVIKEVFAVYLAKLRRKNIAAYNHYLGEMNPLIKALPDNLPKRATPEEQAVMYIAFAKREAEIFELAKERRLAREADQRSRAAAQSAAGQATDAVDLEEQTPGNDTPLGD